MFKYVTMLDCLTTTQVEFMDLRGVYKPDVNIIDIFVQGLSLPDNIILQENRLGEHVVVSGHITLESIQRFLRNKLPTSDGCFLEDMELSTQLRLMKKKVRVKIITPIRENTANPNGVRDKYSIYS